MTQATIYYLDGNQRAGTVAASKPGSGQINLTSLQDHSPIPLQWPLIIHASRVGKRQEFTNYTINLVNGQMISGTMICPAIKTQGPGREKPVIRFAERAVKALAYSVMNDRQRGGFEKDCDLDMAVGANHIGRFRVNVFRQRSEVALARAASRHV